MIVGVMRHLVSGGDNLPDKAGMLRDPFTDDKKSRFPVMGGQQLEDAWCILRVRTVINRQPDFPLRGVETPVQPYQPLRMRRKEMITQQ